MREGWVEKRLKDVASVFAGQSAPQKKEDYSLTGTPFIKAGNLSELISGKTENSILKVTDFAVEKYGLKKYKSGSVLFAKSGMSCLKGYVYVTKCDCYVVSHLAIVQPKDKVNSYYLKYHFMYHKPYLLAKDTAYPSISIADILNYKIILPKIEKQEQIVSELDMITEMISKYDEQLKELDKLSQSIFYEMFGDPVENEKGWGFDTIKNLCSDIVDCPHSTPQKVRHVTNYPCIRTSELKNGNISWDTMQYINEEEYQTRIARFCPKDGDIVFGREGSIGGAVILPKGYHFCLGQRTMLFRVKLSIVSNIYFHRLLLSEWMKRNIRKVNVSSTVAHINIKDIKCFCLPVPPLALQQSFARKIEAIEAMKSKVREAKKEAETLLAARMQYWFE